VTDNAEEKKDINAKAQAIEEKVELLGQLRKAKQRLEKGALLGMEEKKVFTRIRRQLEEDTDGQLTDIEYEQLTYILMYLEIFDSYERNTSIADLDSDLQMQARLYRNQVLSTIEKWRTSRAQTGNFLEQAKLAVAGLEALHGKGLAVEWKNKKRANLSEELKKAEAKKEDESQPVAGRKA
jgi:hypothetical protein